MSSSEASGQETPRRPVWWSERKKHRSGEMRLEKHGKRRRSKSCRIWSGTAGILFFTGRDKKSQMSLEPMAFHRMLRWVCREQERRGHGKAENPEKQQQETKQEIIKSSIRVVATNVQRSGRFPDI